MNENPHQAQGHRTTHRHESHDKHAHHTPEMFRNRFWLSLILTIPVLYFSEQFQAWLGYTAPAFPLSTWINPVLGTVLFFYGGWPFLQGTVREARTRRLGMMTLITLAIGVAYLYSMAVVSGFPGKPFFWELATLISIMILGHWLEMASIQGASRALEHLASLVPDEAHRYAEGRLEDVPVAKLTRGDTILIRPGEQIPIDGEVLSGRSSVNEAFLTGESRPVAKNQGDEVVAGAVNGEGALTVKVTRTGDQTTLSQIQRLVEEAQNARSRFQNLADRAAGWLFYIATGVGALTLLVWIFAADDPQFAIARTVAVLVIACPHALGLAIPLVTVNATAISARNGILVRNREGFERARSLEVIAFDKTGTLTEGAFEVRKITSSGLPENEALRLAAALEQRSEHPLATAIIIEAGRRNTGVSEVDDFEVMAGLGVSGRIDGQKYWLGRAEWPAEKGIDLDRELQRNLREAERRGESVIVLFTNTRGVAVFSLADKVRDSARQAVAQLKRLGVQTVMITGDAEAVAQTVAADLAIDRYYARILPQDKARIVRELKELGPTAFVGDGINDAPALLEANLGIAIGAGTNVAIESADLVLIEDDPLDVLAALELSKATYTKMVQNLFWATGYNLIAIPLAAGAAAAWGILLSPAIGALLMSLSTVIVSINAMLLRRVDLGTR